MERDYEEKLGYIRPILCTCVRRYREVVVAWFWLCCVCDCMEGSKMGRGRGVDAASEGSRVRAVRVEKMSSQQEREEYLKPD